MTTVAYELDRLHRRGYWLRERSVGLRGIWHHELCDSAGRPLAAWQTAPKRPGPTVERLAAELSILDVPAAGDREPGNDEALETILREHGLDQARRHEMDAFLAAEPLSSADELLDHLDRKNLLDPGADA
jgi:hypothetical protein